MCDPAAALTPVACPVVLSHPSWSTDPVMSASTVFPSMGLSPLHVFRPPLVSSMRDGVGRMHAEAWAMAAA